MTDNILYDAAGNQILYRYLTAANNINGNLETDQVEIFYTFHYSTEFGGYKVKEMTSHASAPGRLGGLAAR